MKKNKIKLIVFGALFVLLSVFFAVGISKPVSAASCAGVNTSLLECGADDNQGGGVYYILGLVLNILTYGVGAAGVIGIVICGIQYMTAGGNEAQMTKAKNRIVQVVIGLLCWGLLYAFLEFLIPGGVL